VIAGNAKDIIGNPRQYSTANAPCSTSSLPHFRKALTDGIMRISRAWHVLFGSEKNIAFFVEAEGGSQ
jgi:hypothetical protein